MLETRLAELRVAGRTVSGVLMPYGEVSPDFRERFEPGAFGTVDRCALCVQHDRTQVIAQATLTDTPEALRIEAEVPDGFRSLVVRGALNGFSVEFESIREERDPAGVRVVREALLRGAALVDRGAYRGARAEARAATPRRRRLWL